MFEYKIELPEILNNYFFPSEFIEIEMNKLYQQFCKLEEERKEEAANLEADKEEREKLIDRLTREEIHLGCGITKTEEV